MNRVDRMTSSARIASGNHVDPVHPVKTPAPFGQVIKVTRVESPAPSIGGAFRHTFLPHTPDFSSSEFRERLPIEGILRYKIVSRTPSAIG